MKSLKLIIALGVSLVILIASCNTKSLRIFKSSSARTQYLNTLKNSGIGTTKIGEEWKNSASMALGNASELEIPFAIQGSFRSKSIEAKAWKIQLEQGASITILVNWQANDSSQLFVDLLEGVEGKELESYTIQNDSLQFEADKTGYYMLRIQPELLGEGNFQVRISGTETYAVFPVQGKNIKAIQSVWGDERDGGSRSHEGVDIFATRGTPVLSPVAGVVTAVRDRGLGGKQVWLRDPERDWNLYFAHLDSQLVSNLQRVNPGDTLGLVGNTGNAKTTAPHLHFGIYQNGAINPFPAIKNNFERAPELADQQLPQLMQVNTSQANMRSKPTVKSEVVSNLKLNTPVFIKAATSDWFQIQTADGSIGFLSKKLLSRVDSITLDAKSIYAYTTPLEVDSICVDLEQFHQIGLVQGLKMIRDQDGNVLYLP
ncbi:M23 family metallopeptidase [Algoriphagus aquimarinus]|uniref:SH3 domain-containing protein n=1 Tax=Algoriphagus aquimarinus TaxID=237018 RepID=A0A1I0XQR6_9BACT|nr:M23 family metallopeptidase [Algoriphagus aquimarinus]SFB02283.1 SH3 domain-containing protein [Algoriphagus aquimarinus]